MSYSYTNTDTQTFTATHAKHIAAKVAADLKRIQRLYKYSHGLLSDDWISNFELEVTEFLKHGYLGTVTFGFKRNGKWIEPTLRYTAKDLNSDTDGDDPGKIRPGADISGASFSSYLTYSNKWNELTSDQKEHFKNSLPYQRTGAEEPLIDGYLSKDHTYSSGGKAVDRYQVKSY